MYHLANRFHETPGQTTYGWIEELNGPRPEFGPVPPNDDPRWVTVWPDSSDMGGGKCDAVESSPFRYIRYENRPISHDGHRDGANV